MTSWDRADTQAVQGGTVVLLTWDSRSHFCALILFICFSWRVDLLDHTHSAISFLAHTSKATAWALTCFVFCCCCPKFLTNHSSCLVDLQVLFVPTFKGLVEVLLCPLLFISCILYFICVQILNNIETTHNGCHSSEVSDLSQGVFQQRQLAETQECTTQRGAQKVLPAVW